MPKSDNFRNFFAVSVTVGESWAEALATANRQHIYNAKPFGLGTILLATVHLGLNYILKTKLSSETSAYPVSLFSPQRWTITLEA